jgi:hypothetical protein
VTDILRLLTGISLAWCVLALLGQLLRARGKGRVPHSLPRGSPARGVFYNFTTAMLPAHKESVRLHPAKFAIGALLHAGVLLTLLAIVTLLVAPAAGIALLGWLRVPAAIAALAGLYLLVRRTRDPNLRAMSAPDDFLAIGLSTGLVALAALLPIDADNQGLLLAYATLLLLYLPLGKLRHAVFFFAARADFGRRLGHRGVYPPPTNEAR